MIQAIEFRAVSALEKVFPDAAPHVSPYLGQESILKGESYAFQIAFRGRKRGAHQAVRMLPRAMGVLAPYVTIREVGLVPVELSRFATHDHDFLRGGKPGLYPDVLREVDEKNPLVALNTQWGCAWVEFTPPKELAGGAYALEVAFFDKATGEQCGAAGTQIKVLDIALDAQKLIYTNWFHADCISAYYHVPSLSEEHFALMESFVKTAVKNGMNMILTPVFTPPLDTAVGGERPTVQLMDVSVENGRYHFGFENLRRFIQMCKRNGMAYFEMPHLFTQWGAKAAPKIMATAEGEARRIFGWDTPAMGKAYLDFLTAFLPALTEFLKEEGIASHTFFHISDEPEKEQEQSYRAAAQAVEPYLKGFTVLDALSDYHFYEQGLVKHPIPCNDHIQPFLEHEVAHLWTYYCCAQGRGVSNRFIAMSAARSRILAAQLFKYDIEGFLHWGYNFWYSQCSVQVIDPFAVTDALHAFPAGDAFCVYPGEEGPLESTRLRVFAAMLCDLRAMQMLSRLRSKQAVMSILEADIPPIAFDCAPNNADYIISTRIAINNAIQGAFAQK
ncbi:MAG: DUF4091 domain-containing protein [Clostridia bacterium]